MIIKTPEIQHSTQELITAQRAEQTINVFDGALLEIDATRTRQLTSVKNRISLKYFHEIEQKLRHEQKLIDDLLGIKKRGEIHMAKYSYILDTHYFEQQLLM